MKLNKNKITLALAFGLWLYTFSAEAAPGIMTPGIDHVGITVPSIDEAVKFFADTFGCVPLTTIGPVKLGSSYANDRKSLVPPRFETVTLKMIRCGYGSNIELFEYTKSQGKTRPPDIEDLGGHHIAFTVDDIQAGTEYLRSKGLTVLGEPYVMTEGDTAGETWVHFMSPWGTEMELVSAPHGKAYEKTSKLKLWSPKHPAE